MIKIKERLELVNKLIELNSIRRKNGELNQRYGLAKNRKKILTKKKKRKKKGV